VAVVVYGGTSAGEYDALRERLVTDGQVLDDPAGTASRNG
jgi:molybdopterin biosynthesis enzyme